VVVQFRVPTPSSTTVLNLLGVAGVLCIVFAIGALTDWRWGLLSFGVIAVAFTMMAQTAGGDAAKVASVKDIDTARGRKAA